MAAKPKNKYYIGCSGFHYEPWRKTLYHDRPPSHWLEEYSRIFNSVELNGTFYRQPTAKALKKQHVQTPAGFKFSAKASRYITHVRRLKKSKTLVKDFIQLLESGLEEKLGKILFQLPPNFHFTEENFMNVQESIPDSDLCAIEFRHASWWNDSVMKFFRKQKRVFCNVDFPGLQPPFVSFGKSFYLRLHGVPELFSSPYSKSRLEEITAQLPEKPREFWIYFNNTDKGHAHKNARTLMKILG